MKYVIFTLALLLSFHINAQTELPIISLKDSSGKEVSLQKLSQGKTVVISLWATWCVPCIKELDLIAKDYASLKKENKFELIAISVDNMRTTKRVGPFVKGKNWPYKILLDPKEELKATLGYTSIPYTMIVKDGKIMYRHSTFKPGTESELIDKFKSISKK